MMSMGQEKRLLIYFSIVLLINILLCLVLIPQNPLKGSAWSIILAKALVSFLTVSYCHLQMKLIPGKSLIQLVLVCALSAAFFFFGRGLIIREIVEFFAVLPMVTLIAFWWCRDGVLGKTPPLRGSSDE